MSPAICPLICRDTDHVLTVTSSASDSDRLGHQLEEAVMLQQDYESSASKLKMLEKQVKMLRQEKDEVHKVVPLQREGQVLLVVP